VITTVSVPVLPSSLSEKLRYLKGATVSVSKTDQEVCPLAEITGAKFSGSNISSVT